MQLLYSASPNPNIHVFHTSHTTSAFSSIPQIPLWFGVFSRLLQSLVLFHSFLWKWCPVYVEDTFMLRTGEKVCLWMWESFPRGYKCVMNSQDYRRLWKTCKGKGSKEHRRVYAFVRNLLKRICYTQGLASKVEMCEDQPAGGDIRRTGEPAKMNGRKVLYDNLPGQ